MTYHANGKQVLRDGAHFADCIDSGAATLIADALNDRRTMSQAQRVLPLDGAEDGPLLFQIDKDDRVWVKSGEQREQFPTPPTRDTAAFDAAPLNGPTVGEQFPKPAAKPLLCVSCGRPRQQHRECPHCPSTHSIRQENDEYACSCGARWDVADGEDHP